MRHNAAAVPGMVPLYKRFPTMRDKIEAFSTPVTDSGCWIWLGTVGSNGYGVIARKRVPIGVHRLSYEAFCGPIPAGSLVCHKCDQPLCVNPTHLFLGTHKDNTDDKCRKGRQRWNLNLGAARYGAKLTEDQVRAIRASPKRNKDIAADYGLAANSISNIRSRKLWRHI